METRACLDTTLRAEEKTCESQKGSVSVCSFEEERTSSNVSTPSHPTRSPTAMTPRSAFTQDDMENVPEKEATRVRQLRKENRRLKETIARLEHDLSHSKGETQNANARVSVLVNEITSTKQSPADDGPKQGNDKRGTLIHAKSMQESGLLRQTSTTSDFLDTMSKKSISSYRSSAKSVMGRTASMGMRQEGTYTQRQLKIPLSEEMEAQKLAFAEKLVEKEEMIAKLEKQVAHGEAQLRQMEAGIDGLEVRFDRELDNLKIQLSKKYQLTLQKGQEIIGSCKTAEQGLEQVKKELHKLSSVVTQDIRSLEQKLQKNDQQRFRLGEEKRSIRRKFDAQLQVKAETEQHIDQLREELDRQKTMNDELRYELGQSEEKVALLNGRMADLTIHAQEQTPTIDMQSEIQTLNNRVSSLEEGLAEYESKNRNLIEELDDAHSRIVELEEKEDVDLISKENTELRQEITEVSEKLVDLEQENNTLREEADQLEDALGRCNELEQHVQVLQKQKQEMEGHLTRKKKHIDALQGEIKEMMLNIQNQETDLVLDTCTSQDTVSSHADVIFHAEKRYKDLETVLSQAEAERNQLRDEKSSNINMMQKLLKENKTIAASYKKQQKQNSKVTGKLEEAKAEIAALQGTIYSSCSSRNSSRGKYNGETDVEIMQELVNAKVTLAENDERLITLRRDLHKSLARNVVLIAKASRLETLIKEVKQERGSLIRRKGTRTIRFT